MSFEAMTWAVRFELPVNQKITLLMLANRANPDDGKCVPSISRVARDCGLSAASVRRAITALEDAGLITIIRRRDGDVNLTNAYRLCLDRVLPDSKGVLAEGEGGTCTQQGGVLPDSNPKQRVETENRNRESESDLFSEKVPPKKAVENEVREILTTVISADTAEDFIAHRREMKKPITARAAKALVGKVRDHGNPDAVFRESIANQWQGIFPDRVRGQQREAETDFWFSGQGQ